MQIHRAWYQAGFDADQLLAVEDDIEDLVLVADLRKRQRDRRAAVADALFAVDLLRFVQMAQGDVADAGIEQAGGQGLGAADDQAALGIFRNRAAGHVCVTDGDQRLARLAPGLGGFDQPAVDLADAAQIVVAQLQAGDFGRAQEGQGQAPGGDSTTGVRQRDQQAVAVELTVFEPEHPSQGVGAQAAHQRCRQLDPRAGVVVAGDHHDGQLRLLLVGADDEVVEPFLGFDWRVDGIEDIAGDQQHVRLLAGELGEQPGQEAGVFEIPLLAVKVLAQMPVGGMKQAQCKLREDGGDRSRQGGGAKDRQVYW